MADASRAEVFWWDSKSSGIYDGKSVQGVWPQNLLGQGLCCTAPSEPARPRHISLYSDGVFMGGTTLDLLAMLCPRQPRRLLASVP